MIKMYIGLYVNYRLFVSDFNETRFFLDRFSKNTLIPNFMKIRPVGAEIFPCGRTERHDEADGRFSHFCESASFSPPHTHIYINKIF